MTTPVLLNRSSPTEASLHLYGAVGMDITAQDVATALKSAAGVKNLNLFVDSPGGDLMTGKAIYAQLSRFAKDAKVTATVDGLAASSASFMIMAAQRIVMAPEATMMVHEAHSVVAGRSSDLRKLADILDAENQNLVAIYAKRTGLAEAQVAELLAAETWMNADQAVASGFADQVLEEPKPKPRAEGQVVFAKARAQDLDRSVRLAAMQAEALRIRNLCNAASRAAAPGQPGQTTQPSKET